MKLGLNLSFAVKRWMIPQELASLCKSLGAKYIQFTWDFSDPWCNGRTTRQGSQGLCRCISKGRLDHHRHLWRLWRRTAIPSSWHRWLKCVAGVAYFKRAIDMTRAMGVDVIGSPLGGMDYIDSNDPEKREERYACALDLVREIAAYGKEKGLKEIQIEATPLQTEFPHSPEVAVKLMKDLKAPPPFPFVC